MSKQYDFEIYAHPSIYVPRREATERKLKIYFSEPEAGVNQDTGILLLISGFGGNANSNVYKKMRSQFADTYNLITIQCDYFGWEFMQNPDEISFEPSDLNAYFTKEELHTISQSENPTQTLIHRISKLGKPYIINENLNETLNNFNDMSIMQAMDNISAVIAVLEIIKDNHLQINPNKVIAYGHSQGAYLSYLCNAFAPDLFSLIIDNSAWIFPKYMNGARVWQVAAPYDMMLVRFCYLAHQIDFDKELISLNSLYRKFKNQARILSFHGTKDTLAPFTEKQELIRQTRNAFLYEISECNLNGDIFKSAEHGLDADFLKLFDYVWENLAVFPENKAICLESIFYQTPQQKYRFDYSKGLPIVTIE